MEDGQSYLKEILDNIRTDEDYEANGHFLEYLEENIRKAKKPLPEAERAAVVRFCTDEMQRLVIVIPKETKYRQKSKMFYYASTVDSLFKCMCPSPRLATQDQRDIVNRLSTLVVSETVLERAAEEMLEHKPVEKAHVEKVIAIVSPMNDEYQRGMLYQCLLSAKGGNAPSFTDEAKAALADYIAADLARILDKGTLGEDERDVLEFAVDVGQFFPTAAVLDQVERTMTLDADMVRVYALDTLLGNGREVPADVVRELAADLECADMAHGFLCKHGKQHLFPKEYATPEYLAKSDLVRWLTYPSELGKVPDEISFLGITKIKGETFHIFKFKSDSENLDPDHRNVDLIGWSSDEGGTFSTFEKLSDYEKKTPEKTLRHIIKKILK